MFRSFHIFVFCFFVFWSLSLRDFHSGSFRLAHLALQNVNIEYVIFLYFCNFVSKSDQKPKMKNWMNETNITFLWQKFAESFQILSSLKNIELGAQLLLMTLFVCLFVKRFITKA